MIAAQTEKAVIHTITPQPGEDIIDMTIRWWKTKPRTALGVVHINLLDPSFAAPRRAA